MHDFLHGRWFRPLLIAALVLAALFAWKWVPVLSAKQGYPFLSPASGVPWIKIAWGYHLQVSLVEPKNALFSNMFTVESIPDEAVLEFRSLGIARVFLNNRLMGSFPDAVPGVWNRVDIAPGLREGQNLIVIEVVYDRGPPAVQARCEAVGLVTSNQWREGPDASMNVIPSEIKFTRTFDREYPTLGDVLPGQLLWSVFFLFLGGAGYLLADRIGTNRLKKAVIWIIPSIFVFLCAHNILLIDYRYGFDAEPHYQYMRFIAKEGKLPLATDGYMMFQAPLYYTLQALPYRWVVLGISVEEGLKWLRLLPMLCGLFQIWVAARITQLVYPEKPFLVPVAMLMGLIPVNIYMSHAPGNEAMVGALVALLLYRTTVTCLRERNMTVASLELGAIFGLAILTKVSAILTLPALVIALAIRSRQRDRSIGRVFINLLLAGGASFVVAGWYYLRNWALLGGPLAGNWVTYWWQAPGYRQPSDFESFGTALWNPIYSGMAGFWDGLYSTLWTDAYLGGRAYQIWHEGPLLILPILSLPLMVLIVWGGYLYLEEGLRRWEPVRLLAVLATVGYLAGLTYFCLSVPNFSAVKSSYAMGALPCLVLFLTRAISALPQKKPVHILTCAWLTCWTLTVTWAFVVARAAE